MSKKNLWKNPFRGTQANTYHGKKFSKLFTDLEAHETCLNSYKCTFIPKTSSNLMNGRIYLTQCNIFFYSKATENSFILTIRLSQIESVRKEKRNSKTAIRDTIRICTDTQSYDFTNFVIINNLYKPLKKMLIEAQSNEQFEIIDDDNRNTPDMVVTVASKEDNSESESSGLSCISMNHEAKNEEKIKPSNDKPKRKAFVDKEMVERFKLYDQTGRVYIDKDFDASPECAFYYLFDNNEFYNKFWGSRKFYGIKINEWEIANGYKRRKLEYLMEAMGGSKICKTFEEQRIIEYDPKKQIVLDSESFSEGVPYADAFSVRNRFRLTYVDLNRCNMHVTTLIYYAKKPNFIARAFIEKNCNTAMSDNFAALTIAIAQETKTGIPSSYTNTHEVSAYQPDVAAITSRLLEYEDVKASDDDDTCTISSLKNEYPDFASKTNVEISKVSSQLTSTSSFSSDFSALSHRINVTDILSRYNSPIAIIAILLITILLFLNLYVIMKLQKIEELTDTLTNCSNICQKMKKQ